MKQATQMLFRAGCLVSVLAPIVAIVLYPSTKWLFAFVLLGVGLLIFGIITAKDPTPEELADCAERLLSGTYAAWDVDDYEHANPKDPVLKDLWRSTMSAGGLPEEWVRLDEEKQNEIREIIRKLRGIGVTSR
jgi:hypothetical protein